MIKLAANRDEYDEDWGDGPNMAPEWLNTLPKNERYVNALQAFVRAKYPLAEAFDMVDSLVRRDQVDGTKMKEVADKEEDIDWMMSVASALDQMGLLSIADAVDQNLKKIAADKPKGSFIFPRTHPKVKDKKDHFPINTRGRGRNALSRANQFLSVPTWYSGSLKEFVSSVARAVKTKYPSIEVSKKAKKPNKGPMTFNQNRPYYPYGSILTTNLGYGHHDYHDQQDNNGGYGEESGGGDSGGDGGGGGE